MQVVTLPYSLKAVLPAYLALWAQDAPLARQRYNDVAKQVRIAPLAAQLGHTLFPLRSRKPVGAWDGAYAYLEWESLDLTSCNPTAAGINVDIGGFRQQFLCSEKQLRLMAARAAYAAARYQQYHASRAASRQEQQPVIFTERCCSVNSRDSGSNAGDRFWN